MGKGVEYYRKLYEEIGPAPESQKTGQPGAQQPQEESPIDYAEQYAGIDAGTAPGAAQEAPGGGMDVLQGNVQGVMDRTQDDITAMAGDRSQQPESYSAYIAQIPGMAIDLMTGGRGGEVLRRLDLGQYGPGVPKSNEGQLGYELADATRIAATAGAPMAGAKIAKQFAPPAGEVALAHRMGQSGRQAPDGADPRQAYADDVMAQSHPGGAPATKEQARAKFTEMEQADDYGATVMSAKPKPPQAPKHADINQPVPQAPKPQKAPRMPQTAYRDRIKKLISTRDDLISKRHMRELMADDGMTVAQFIKLKRQIGARTKPHPNPMMEKPMAAQKRGAYAEAASALDSMELPPMNAALEMYGEGAKLWKVASGYKRAQELVKKFVKTGEDGDRLWRSKSFQDELEKMDPKVVEEIFGPQFKRIINAAKRITYRGYKARGKSEKKNRLAIWRKLKGWGFLGGVTYAVHKTAQNVKAQFVGAPMTRPGRGPDR